MTSEICSRVNPRRGADSTSIEEEGEPVLDSTNAPDIAVVFWELLWELPLPTTTEMHRKERGEAKKATKQDLSLQQQQRDGCVISGSAT
ncbi:unnamed protein product [Sphagnum troendelagicum]|uniref:Uncharacterized protein n=1 Tax=Sphagnum troendelagicum TaxID=128251 RepID=A0ABP0UAL8_9BRYO